MAQNTDSVILLSGGLDSAANLAFAFEEGVRLTALTVDYGQRAAEREKVAAQALAKYYGATHQILDLKWLGALGGSALTDSSQVIPDLKPEKLDEMKAALATAAKVWVPNRNGVLINAAAAIAERLGAGRVIVGFNREEAATFPDNSAEFLRIATAALGFSTANGVEVFCYTSAWDKREILTNLKSLKRKPFPIEKIWSCYRDGATPCGVCESCRRLARARSETGW